MANTDSASSELTGFELHIPFFDRFDTDPTKDYKEYEWNKFMTNPIFTVGLLLIALCWHCEGRQEVHYCYNTKAECKDQDHDILNCSNFQSARSKDTEIQKIDTKINEVECVLSTLIEEHFGNNFEECVETRVIGIKMDHRAGFIIEAPINTSNIVFHACGIALAKISEAACLAFDLSPYIGSR